MSTVLKQHSRGILLQANGDCPDRVHSDQMVHRKVRREAGPQKRWPKALRTKLNQGGLSGSSPLRYMVLIITRREAGPRERRLKMLKGEMENLFRKPRDLVGKLA
jgi:hypothetical protein